MNRSDFQKLAELRLAEAKVLLDAKHYEGAFYLAGYTVECALKACIAKRTKEHDFPDKRLVGQIYKHDPEELLKAAGLEAELLNDFKSDKDLERKWAQVVNWSEESRYETRTYLINGFFTQYAGSGFEEALEKPFKMGFFEPLDGQALALQGLGRIYEIGSSKSEASAKDFYDAVADASHGVFQWLKKSW